MCDYNVYLKKGDEEILLMETVQSVDPVEGGYRIVSLFGEEKIVSGKIHSLALVDHRIVLTETPADLPEKK